MSYIIRCRTCKKLNPNNDVHTSKIAYFYHKFIPERLEIIK